MTATTIYTKTSADGKPVEITYDGHECQVVVGGKAVAKGAPRWVSAEQARRSKMPAGVELLIGKAMLTSADARPIKDGINRIRAEQAARRLAALEAVMPGLSAVRAAWDAHEAYGHDFRSMLEDEGNDGLIAPIRPGANLDTLAEQYPAAALYVRIERALDTASNEDKIADLKDARAILEAGGPIADAREAVGTWLS